LFLFGITRVDVIPGDVIVKRRMPTFNALKAFEMAGITGNFTRAAELLNVTQSAVSRQVRQLEDQLGEPLLLRRHHHLQLTDAGKLLLRALQQSFDSIELTVRGIQQKAHLNRLRVNAPPTFASRWFLPRLGRLRDAHDDIEVTLTSRLHDDLKESGRLDCAIRFGNGEWDGLDCTLLMQEHHIAVCSPALLEATGQQRDNVDLSGLTLLHVLADPNHRYMTWSHWLVAAGIPTIDLHEGYEFDLLDLAIRAAINGLGVAIADRQMVNRELASGQLVQVKDIEVIGHQSYWFVTRPGRVESESMAAFRSWLGDEVQLAAEPVSA
jgi:LysR family transcriptional regulator, glycine cleavage system transcriptional activator